MEDYYDATVQEIERERASEVEQQQTSDSIGEDRGSGSGAEELEQRPSEVEHFVEYESSGPPEDLERGPSGAEHLPTC